MKKFLFIGEKRSSRAKQLNVTWKDGKLAAKHLFEALNRINIDINDCEFKNIFYEHLDNEVVNPEIINDIKVFNGNIIAMGRKVEKILKKKNIDHFFIYHPATRGSIRNLNNYCNHVSLNLKPILI